MKTVFLQIITLFFYWGGAGGWVECQFIYYAVALDWNGLRKSRRKLSFGSYMKPQAL